MARSSLSRVQQPLASTLAVCGLLIGILPGPAWATSCPAERTTPLLPRDPALCASLEAVVRKPRALPLDQYQARLGDYLRNFCHRNAATGWKPDKRVRDTGPYLSLIKI